METTARVNTRPITRGAIPTDRRERQRIRALPRYWVVVSIPLGATGEPDAPRLAMVKRDQPLTFYWGGGPGRYPATSGKGIRFYAFYDPNQMDEGEIEVDFIRRFRAPKPVREIEARSGWISPEGDVYHCHYAEHDDVARELVAVLWGRLGASDDIENAGWLRIMGEGRITNYRNHGWRTTVTQAQRDRIFDLSLARPILFHREDEWLANMRRNLREIEDK